MNSVVSFVGMLLCIPLFASNAPALCTGSDAMLAISDRPSVAFSACTVPNNTLYVESGYSYTTAIPKGYGFNLPQTEMRFGTTNNTEIDFFPPNYIAQNHPNITGSDAMALGLKHIVASDQHSIFTLQGYVSPPSGTTLLGSINTSFLISSLYNYTFDSGLSITTTMACAANAASASAPKPNFYTFNPIVDLGWPFTDKLAGYLEVYSQSKSAANQGWGISGDGGLLYLLTPFLSVNAAYGHRILGYLNNTTGHKVSSHISNVDYYYSLGLVFSLDLVG